MKIFIMNSSFRKDGNTNRILECFMEEFQSCSRQHGTDVEFETVFLAHENIQMCRGCRLCFDRGEDRCPLKDEVLPIRDKLCKADAAVLAGPVYVEDVNGFMKNWIDRMAFNSHRPSLYGKPAAVLTTSASYSSNHSLKTVIRAINSWGGVVVARGKFRMGALMAKDEVKARHGAGIKMLAEKLYASSGGSKAGVPSVYSLVAFKIQQKYWRNKKETQSHDYSYWKGKGWLESGCNYYTVHKAGWFKTGMAGVLGSLASIFLEDSKK